MGPNFYATEKASEVHRRDLLREAERQRLLVQLPRQRWEMSRHIAGRVGSLLLWLGARVKQVEQKYPGMLEDHP